jgi:hypothetical protein
LTPRPTVMSIKTAFAAAITAPCSRTRRSSGRFGVYCKCSARVLIVKFLRSSAVFVDDWDGKAAVAIELSGSERRELLSLARAQKTGQAMARRARIVLAIAAHSGRDSARSLVVAFDQDFLSRLSSLAMICQNILMNNGPRRWGKS